MHPSSIAKWFRNFLKNNNLPNLNFHGLRHTSATFLISKGMDIETVAGRLGHSTSATTHNIYSHLLEAKYKKAADIMEKSFSRRKNKKLKIRSINKRPFNNKKSNIIRNKKHKNKEVTKSV